MASFFLDLDRQSQGSLNIAIVNRVTGEVSDPLLVDRRSGQIITAEDYTFAPVSATQGASRPGNVLPVKTTGGSGNGP